VPIIRLANGIVFECPFGQVPPERDRPVSPEPQDRKEMRSELHAERAAKWAKMIIDKSCFIICQKEIQ
jgi:hypothetical protein